MDIKLLVENKEKRFTVPFVKGRMLRRAIELQKQFDGKEDDALSVEELDIMVDFVVELFNGQFSLDEFYDGVSVDELIPTITKYIQMTMGKPDPNVKKREK